MKEEYPSSSITKTEKLYKIVQQIIAYKKLISKRDWMYD